MKRHVLRNVLRIGLFLAVAAGLIVWLGRRFRRRVISIDPTSLITEPDVAVTLHRQSDSELVLRWWFDADQVEIYGGVSPDLIEREAPLAMTSGGREVTIRGLQPGVRYYFELVFQGDAPQKPLRVAERTVQLTGAVNFRDIGGYQTRDGRVTRWNRVYRAGTLTNLTVSDHFLLKQIGVKLSCDLRSEEEMAEAPDRLPDGVRYLPLPVQSSQSNFQRARSMFFQEMDAIMLDAYTRVMIDHNASVLGALYRRIADSSNLPLVVHCTAGKDRTGIAVALLLAFLGVPDDIIAADYSLSNRYYDNFVEVTEHAIKPFKRWGVTLDRVQPLLMADPRMIRATLNYVRQNYGSVRGYFQRRLVLDDATLQKLEDNLLESS